MTNWIKCSARLPSKNGYYLLKNKRGLEIIGLFNIKNKVWRYAPGMIFITSAEEWLEEIPTKTLIPIPIPLRDDILVKIVGLPYNLSKKEALKIENLLKAFTLEV